MTLRHIEVFHAIYTNGSASSAAQALNVSQPSISKVLRHAEIRLGYDLFHRAKGRLVPTDEAHALFREVDEIYSRIGSLRQTATNIGRRASDHLRIGVLPGYGLDIVPKAIAKFRATQRSVSFTIQTMHTADILRALHEQYCDLVIAFEMPRHPQLTQQDIGTGELMLLYRTKDLANAPERVGLQVLEQHDFIRVEAESGPLGRLFANEIARQDLKLREVVVISTMYIAVPLVRAGLGMAVIDSITAATCVGDDLAYRRLDPPLEFQMRCVSRSDRPLSRLAKRFISTLRDVMREG